MLATLTKEDWLRCLDGVFVVDVVTAGELAIKLTAVSGYGKTIGGTREAYSLLFCGPSMPILPQQIYTVRHQVIGELDIFLVPIGPQSEGMGYEAVFT